MANKKRNSAAVEGKAAEEKTAEGKTVEMVSSYEKLREERIKANLEKIRKLGILDLSLKLQSFSSVSSATTTNQNSRSRRRNAALSASATPNPNFSINQLLPRRKSSRLENVDPVSYVDTKNDDDDKLGTSRNRLSRFLINEGTMEEIYTEEHAALLGSCETSWTLFVDGCDNDGKRIYDQFSGKTCHQCRQKTLGHHTNCCKCSNLVQGQFCGDCLYMRYGENVLEVEKNPTWICPPCRGICNCSICRTRKGWAPTGNLYRKISKLGYKSVAHFLIQTKCKTNIENRDDANKAIDNVEEENALDDSKHDINKEQTANMKNIEHTSDEGSKESQSTVKEQSNIDIGHTSDDAKEPSNVKENLLADSIGSRLRQRKRASTVA